MSSFCGFLEEVLLAVRFLVQILDVGRGREELGFGRVGGEMIRRGFRRQKQ